MQIRGLHSSFYKLYSYSRKQECLEAYRKKYKNIVSQWDALKSAGTAENRISEFVDYSRATYYRAKRILKLLSQGKVPPSKRPKKANRPQWGEKEKQLVLRIRRENPSYGKFKISRILNRDFDCHISESTVGRILAYLRDKGLIIKSASAVRAKRKRNFNTGHARSWSYKEYNDMSLGERV